MKIGIIGAGVMGSSIAQVFIMTPGYDVAICDITQEAAQTGKKRVTDALAKLAKRGKITPEALEDMKGRITAGTNEAVADCDLVLEAIVESMEAKQELFKSLQAVCKKDAIFATNTSSLSVTEMAHGLDRSVVGFHFFNPAPVMKLVEVVTGLTTPPEVFEKVKQITIDIGKTPVEVKDAAGFVVNRILIPMINEAVNIYSDSTASAADIDKAMKLGANHPMGPLELGDLIGLDVVLDIMLVLYEETKDPKYRPHFLLRRMVRGGLLGRKTGRGFYTYPS